MFLHIFLIFIFNIYNLKIIADNKEYQTSRTFLFIKNIYNNPIVDNFYRIYDQYKFSSNNDNIDINNIFLVDFLYQDLKNSNDIAKYFSIGCKDYLLVAGDDSYLKHSRNIRAEWFNLPSDSSFYIEFKPKQSQKSLLLQYYRLFNYFCDGIKKDFWISFNLPILNIEGNLSINYFDIKNVSLDVIKNSFEKFNNVSFYNKNISNTYIPDIKFSLGAYLPINYLNFALYSSLVIPSSEYIKPKYLFEPIPSSNGHFAIEIGSRITKDFPINDNFSIYYFLQLNNYFYFSSKEYRTFDLKNASDDYLLGQYQTPCTRQWSRYLKFIEKNSNNISSGVDILTQKVQVHPYSSGNIFTGLNFVYNNLNIELSYNFWGKSHDKVKILSDECETLKKNINFYGILYDKQDNLNYKTSFKSSISCLANYDKKFKTINLEDINIISGSFPGAFSNQIGITINYIFAKSLYFSYAFFYEIAYGNSALSNSGGFVSLDLLF